MEIWFESAVIQACENLINKAGKQKNPKLFYNLGFFYTIDSLIVQEKIFRTGYFLLRYP